MTAAQLVKLLEKAGLSQLGAARRLGVDPRTIRRYVAGDLPVPRVVELALWGLQAVAVLQQLKNRADEIPGRLRLRPGSVNVLVDAVDAAVLAADRVGKNIA
jgi:hypothetical protein